MRTPMIRIRIFNKASCFPISSIQVSFNIRHFVPHIVCSECPKPIARSTCLSDPFPIIPSHPIIHKETVFDPSHILKILPRTPASSRSTINRRVYITRADIRQETPRTMYQSSRIPPILQTDLLIRHIDLPILNPITIDHLLLRRPTMPIHRDRDRVRKAARLRERALTVRRDIASRRGFSCRAPV